MDRVIETKYGKLKLDMLSDGSVSLRTKEINVVSDLRLKYRGQEYYASFCLLPVDDTWVLVGEPNFSKIGVPFKFGNAPKTYVQEMVQAAIDAMKGFVDAYPEEMRLAKLDDLKMQEYSYEARIQTIDEEVKKLNSNRAELEMRLMVVRNLIKELKGSG